jgi:hypothetical protein
METDLIADLILAATLIGVCVIFCGLSRHQRKELTRNIGKMGADVDDNIGEMRTAMAGGIKELHAEIRGTDERLDGRIDAVRDELVEARVALADRVARVEGRLSRVPRPDTGTDASRA